LLLKEGGEQDWWHLRKAKIVTTLSNSSAVIKNQKQGQANNALQR
jgi:hypothetical protein